MLSCEDGKAVERMRQGDEEPGGGRHPRRESVCGTGSTRIPKRGWGHPPSGR
jgi:hypothetical protein